ncbi:hypothetical protein JST97_15065 [bacterium]|nr:hypothetical protein [bacterium]
MHRAREQIFAMDILKRLQAEGRLDSQGKFTLDLAARQEKLIVLQRQEPWLFVFKLAQAAVRSGARQLNITSDEQHLVVEFVPEETSGEDFPAALLGADKLRAPWLRHLAMGVILAFAAEGRRHSLLYDDGERRTELEAGGGPGPAGGPSPLVRVRIENYPRSWWKSWLRPPPIERLRLDMQRRLSLFPIDLVINGSSLAALVGEQIPGMQVRSGANHWLYEWLYPDARGFAWAAPSSRIRRLEQARWRAEPQPVLWQGHDSRPLEALAEKLEQQQAVLLAAQIQDRVDPDGYWKTYWDLLVLPQARSWMTRRPHPEIGQAQFQVCGRAVGMQAVVQLPFVPQGMARIVPVSDGVCLEPIDFPQGPPGAVAYLQREDWEVDLGQLRTLPNPAARAQALQAWDGQLKELESFVYLPQKCEEMRLPLAARDGWRNYLRKRK